jgi:hypothetical protein
MTLQLLSIHTYPIKSCAGIDHDTALAEARGFQGDRRFMIVDRDGKFITQRTDPNLARVKLKNESSGLRVSAQGFSDLHVPFDFDKDTKKAVEVWSSTLEAWDCGEAVADWFSRFLTRPVRLVGMDADIQRKRTSTVNAEDFEVSFADGYPYLLTASASLDDLNARLETPVPMDRFRANLVVSTEAAFIEESWRRIQIGSIIFQVVKPCGRCTITTVNQSSGIAGKEPLKTLSTYRRAGNQVNFGMNLLAETTGPVKRGDSVTVIQ